MRYADPRGLVVQVWQGDKTLCEQPCVDAGDAATEADRLFTDCCPPPPSADQYNRDFGETSIREPGGLMRDPLTLVEHAREHFAAAFNRQDISALRALCEDDLILLPPNHLPIVGVESALDWWRAGFSVSRTRLRLASRELNLADGWVFDWFDWSLSIVPTLRGAPMIDQGTSFWIWRLEGEHTCRVTRQLWNSSTDIPSHWAGGRGSSPTDGFPKPMTPRI